MKNRDIRKNIIENIRKVAEKENWSITSEYDSDCWIRLILKDNNAEKIDKNKEEI